MKQLQPDIQKQNHLTMHYIWELWVQATILSKDALAKWMLFGSCYILAHVLQEVELVCISLKWRKNKWSVYIARENHFKTTLTVMFGSLEKVLFVLGKMTWALYRDQWESNLLSLRAWAIKSYFGAVLVVQGA
jgi:uncharacterized membrane protein